MQEIWKTIPQYCTFLGITKERYSYNNLNLHSTFKILFKFFIYTSSPIDNRMYWNRIALLIISFRKLKHINIQTFKFCLLFLFIFFTMLDVFQLSLRKLIRLQFQKKYPFLFIYTLHYPWVQINWVLSKCSLIIWPNSNLY